MTTSLHGSFSEQTPEGGSGPVVCPMYAKREAAPIRLVAFDLSLTATGWASSDGKSGVLHPPKHACTGLNRIAWIRGSIPVIAGAAQLVLIEQLAYAARGRAMLDLAGIGMVVRMGFHDRGIPFLDVANNTIKKFATGKGNAQKADMLAAAIRRLDYQGSDHNEADALWLLQMALHHYGCPGAVTLPAAQLESLGKVKWPQLKRRAA